MFLYRFAISILTFSVVVNALAIEPSFFKEEIEVNGKQIKAKDLVKDIVRISKSKSPKYIPVRHEDAVSDDIPRHNSGASELCIECRDIAELASNISDIVAKANENSQEPSIKVKQKALKLKAIATYIETVDKVGEISCLKSDFDSGKERYNTRDFDDFELVFTSDIALSEFSSLSIAPRSGTLTRITWFRSQDEVGEDIFIKVVFIKDQEPYFQIYYPHDTFVDPTKPTDVERNIPEGVTLETNYDSEMSLVKDQEYDTFIGKVKINKALLLEQSYYVPTSLTLIEMETESKLGEETKLTSKVEINDQKQRINVNLNSKLTEDTTLNGEINIKPNKQQLNLNLSNRYSDDITIDGNADISSDSQQINLDLKHQGKSTARALAKADGYLLAGVTVASPEFRNFDIETDMSYDTNQTATIANDFRFQGKTIIKTGTVINAQGEVDFSAKRSFGVFENATVTMELNHSTQDRGIDYNRTSAYISFDMKF
ncbi:MULTISPECIES: hypothetical protein [unclassified Halobacteriovorax]|uniref:hypothetical protein n=1 Tax=unclassified Halobacteriovorax TaxID=2639665 RepID=UPI00399A14D1